MLKHNLLVLRKSREGMNDKMQQYLARSEFIDWDHPAIIAKAAELADGLADESEVAKRSFEFVRVDFITVWTSG